MATGTTLLSYEMSWELKLFELMTNCQQAGDYIMACIYGEAFYRILGMKELPSKKTPEKKGPGPEMESWRVYFIELMLGGVGRVGDNIARVRSQYKDKKEIPDYVQPQVTK